MKQEVILKSEDILRIAIYRVEKLNHKEGEIK